MSPRPSGEVPRPPPTSTGSPGPIDGGEPCSPSTLLLPALPCPSPPASIFLEESELIAPCLIDSEAWAPAETPRIAAAAAAGSASAERRLRARVRRESVRGG